MELHKNHILFYCLKPKSERGHVWIIDKEFENPGTKIYFQPHTCYYWDNGIHTNQSKYD